MTSSVDGLVSGLSTSSMINQMMQVEAASQTKLKTKVETAKTAVTSYQSVNAKLSAAKSAADVLGRLETWRSVKATSSSEGVTATATGGLSAMSGSIKFNVDQVAKAQTTIVPNVDTTVTTYPNSINITLGGYTAPDGDGDGQPDFDPGTNLPKNITVTGDATPEKIAAAVNSAGLGIRAYVVKTTGNEGVLQFTGMKSGAANGFKIEFDGASAPFDAPITTQPQDAKVTLNPGEASAYSVTSTSNVFSALMPGVSLTVSKPENGVTVDAVADVSAIADKFKAFVDATNEALTEIKTQTAYDAETRTASPLTGDFTIRQMMQTLMGQISGGLNSKMKLDTDGKKILSEPYDFGSLKQLGISLSKDGKQLDFDAGAFTTAYNKDATKIQEAGQIFGNNIKLIANKQTKSVTDVITGRKNEIDSLNGQISNWDVRLSARREALQRQYAALETSLGSLKNQSSWLSGQLAGLA
ncbi:flagellar filament capping protein FliD [Actinoplanes sp. NPDC051861]|uniref:flagellar filament capping protein FliD n=1 Tax=Actinoplanes sp. NPDC051861 TaxID=3155170 RepID=UPI003427B22C